MARKTGCNTESYWPVMLNLALPVQMKRTFHPSNPSWVDYCKRLMQPYMRSLSWPKVLWSSADLVAPGPLHLSARCKTLS